MNEINKALEALRRAMVCSSVNDVFSAVGEAIDLLSAPAAADVVAWMDDGTTLSGPRTTSFRVITDEQKRAMPAAVAAAYTTALGALPMTSAPEPVAGQCGESCERAKLCGACARGLEEGPEPAASEREAFEAWARDQWGDRPVPNNAWLGWQGRAALAAAQPAPVEAQADLLAKRADEEMARAEHYKERALRAEAQAVPAGWSIRRTPGKAEIGITTPEDGPGGMFVSPSDRDLARRVLYALCESLSASNQNGGE